MVEMRDSTYVVVGAIYHSMYSQWVHRFEIAPCDVEKYVLIRRLPYL